MCMYDIRYNIVYNTVRARASRYRFEHHSFGRGVAWRTTNNLSDANMYRARYDDTDTIYYMYTLHSSDRLSYYFTPAGYALCTFLNIFFIFIFYIYKTCIIHSFYREHGDILSPGVVQFHYNYLFLYNFYKVNVFEYSNTNTIILYVRMMMFKSLKVKSYTWRPG